MVELLVPYPLPMPLPQPIPRPVPRPVPEPEPGPVSPGPGSGIGIPIPGTSGGTIGQPFADLFSFPVDWKYLGAVLFLAVTVNFVERYNPDYGFVYAGILLLGVIVVDGRFGPALARLVGR